MTDLHESNVKTLEVAHILTHASRIVTAAIDKKLEENFGADHILIDANRLREIRILVAAQEEAIRKLVERDLEISDMIVKAANTISK